MKELGVLVFGYRRPGRLRNVLESLRRQGALGMTHVWIDGFSHSREVKSAVESVRALANEFSVAGWHNCHGHLGIEKLMLDGLTEMARQYDRIVVLEDDCFPCSDAIKVFRSELDIIHDDPTVYSVYGHHFQVEGEGANFTRFQGWGWATTREKLLPILEQLKSLFLMTEPDYLAWTASSLKPEIRKRLDVTGRRDVTKVLQKQFSWDSATALLTAQLGLTHRRTPHQVVYNCGAGENSGHFPKAVEEYRAPPFNMIGFGEVWQYFNRPLAPQYRGRNWFGVGELDRKLSPFVSESRGFFVELGACDGLAHTNTLALERRGWHGLLIEADLDCAAECRLNRPLATVVNAACVSSGPEGGAEAQSLARNVADVPARSISSIFDEHGVTHIDLLSLYVQGMERQVLDGLDFSRYSPRLILVEDTLNGDLLEYLSGYGFEMLGVLNERGSTRDILLRCNQ